MPEACSSAWRRLASRALVLLCAVTLLAGASLAAPGVATGNELGSQISSGRRSQAYFESVMLSQDAALARIKGQTRLTHRALKQARRAVTHGKRALSTARHVVAERTGLLAELEGLHAGTPIELIPESHVDRLRSVRRELARAKSRRVQIGRQLRTAVRQRHARQYRLGVLKRQRSAAVSRRESAEGGLGAYIVELTRLAELRAENQSAAQLTTSTGFTWPSVGRISQTYGCTGYRLNPRRGSCAHFHDGLDIVAGYGSRVASAADGVVAYAGWNPWDEGGRAWLMVVSHPDGYVTRYGHLLPGALARVGQFVRQGEAIGRMGNTGRSTGTHLHFELLQGGTTVSPWTYLPAGMVTVKVARHPDKKAHDRSRGDERAAGPRAASRNADRTEVRRASRQGQGRAVRPAGVRTAAGQETAADRARGARLPATSLSDITLSGAASEAAAPAAAELSVSRNTPVRPVSQSAVDLSADICRSSFEAKRTDSLTAGQSELPRAAGSAVASRPSRSDDPCVITGPASASHTEGSTGTSLAAAPDDGRDPGVPQPLRGTSPVPS